MHNSTKGDNQKMYINDIIGNVSLMISVTCTGTGNNDDNYSFRPIILQLTINCLCILKVIPRKFHPYQ